MEKYSLSNESHSKSADKTQTAQKISGEASKVTKTTTPIKKARGHCSTSESSSHSKYFIRRKYGHDFKQINRDQYYNVSESISSSDTYHCIHGPEGKIYTQEGLLKRNFLKELDPIVIPNEFTEKCPVMRDWGIANTLAYLIKDKFVLQQLDRFQSELRELARISSEGYRVDILDSLTVIIEFLLDTVDNVPELKKILLVLLSNLQKPILLTSATDFVKFFPKISHFIGYMGYLLMKIFDDHMFDVVSKAIMWQLTAPDPVRGPGSASLRHVLAAASILIEPTVKMLAIAPVSRFSTFLEINLLLALDSEDNCIKMMKENIIEVIFYRFNPFFPYKDLPQYDTNPADCQDMNLKLGASSVNISTTMSLLLVLVKTTKRFLVKHPQYGVLLPCPDYESQRCFIWAYRYECRARGHHHERITLTIIAAALLNCFGSRLRAFSSVLMPDIMSLSVFTELPRRNDWLGTVNFNTMQYDVLFKKILIHFVVDLLKTFPCNKFMVKSRYWLLGMMYLLDPGLTPLRAHWSSPHYAEIRKIALQALVCTLPLCDYNLVAEYALIRRMLWYIEWYTESPYEIQILYWCVRLLLVTVSYRNTIYREIALKDLFDTHGIIILSRLCYTLMSQKKPPVEKSQAVLSVCNRLLASAAHRPFHHYVACCVYPNIIWPNAIVDLTRYTLKIVLECFEKHYIISDRWLVALLNFIWEGVIWKSKFRKVFVTADGIYKLLDIITMSRPAVQCIALAMICDVIRAGEAVGQVVTWRASSEASNANPILVKRGATIATLLAAIFRDECQKSGIKLDANGILEDLDHPIMKPSTREAIYKQDLSYIKSHSTPVCLIAAEMAGSRMSKAFAILHMLSEDLSRKVEIADEAYNLYKNITLEAQDESILVLCTHYLTLKLNEVWKETQIQSSGFMADDELILNEFLHISKGWANEIKWQQEEIIMRDQKKNQDEEKSLYEFLGRVRLNQALDALKEIRCVARSADRYRITHDLLYDAVFAHQRLSVFAQKIEAPILRTYRPMLDDYNMTGQNVKVDSINFKDQSRLVDLPSATTTAQDSE